MKLFDKELFRELDAPISIENTPNSGEPNFRIDLRYGFSILLMKRGVSRPFWAIQVETCKSPASIIRGWWDEEIVISLAHDLHVLIDRDRIIVSPAALFPVIRTGQMCGDCGRETAYCYSDNDGRENVNYGVDFSTQYCTHCGTTDYMPGCEPNPEEPEVPEMDEYIPEETPVEECFLTLSEEGGAK